jgi:hypothetical protein
VMAAAHIKALEGHVDPAPPVTRLTFTKKGKIGWSTGFGILDRNLTLKIHKADSAGPTGVMQVLMLAGNQARVGIHPSRKRSNGDDCLLLVGRNEKGSIEELVAHADTDAEMYEWLAGVRRTMDAYAEHGAFMPSGGAADPAMVAMDSRYDAALAAAIAASMGEAHPAGTSSAGMGMGMGMGMDGGVSAEDEMAIALAMSMEDQGGDGAASLASSMPQPAVRAAQVRRT